MFRTEFVELGCVVDRYGPFLKVTDGPNVCFTLVSETSFTSLLAARIEKNKSITKRLLAEAGLKVAPGKGFSEDEKEAAFRECQALERFVVKPEDGNKGKGVSVDVALENFYQAWDDALNASSAKRVIVERYYPDGIEARYLVIDNRVVAVLEKVKPHVVGDGTHTLLSN